MIKRLYELESKIKAIDRYRECFHLPIVQRLDMYYFDGIAPDQQLPASIGVLPARGEYVFEIQPHSEDLPITRIVVKYVDVDYLDISSTEYINGEVVCQTSQRYSLQRGRSIVRSIQWKMYENGYSAMCAIPSYRIITLMGKHRPVSRLVSQIRERLGLKATDEVAT